MLKWRMLRMSHPWFPQHVFCTIFVSSSMMGQLKISLMMTMVMIMMMMTNFLFQFQGRKQLQRGIRWSSFLTTNIKQSLDEVEHDIMNYQNRGLCYLPKPKAEADNTDTRF